MNRFAHPIATVVIFLVLRVCVDGIIVEHDANGLDDYFSENTIGLDDYYFSDVGYGKAPASTRAVVTFDFHDWCHNYELPNCNYSIPTNTTDQKAPYRGLEPHKGNWFFHDQIVYELDIHTVKVTVRHGHDMLSRKRKHVFMMRLDGSREYFQYNVVNKTDSNNTTTSHYTHCESNPPEAVDESGIDAPKNPAITLFHSRLRSFLRGFGHLKINLTQLESLSSNPPASRGEAPRQGVRTTSGPVEYVSGTTNENVHSHTTVDNYSSLMRKTNMSQDEARDTFSNLSGGFHAQTKTNNSSATMHKSKITALDPEIRQGLIVWPNFTRCGNLTSIDAPPHRSKMHSAWTTFNGTWVNRDPSWSDMVAKSTLNSTGNWSPVSTIWKNNKTTPLEKDEIDFEDTLVYKFSQAAGFDLKKLLAEGSRAINNSNAKAKSVIQEDPPSCDRNSSWVEKNIQAGIKNTTWTVEDFGSLTNLTPHCSDLKSQATITYGYVAALAKGKDSLMGMFDNAASTFHHGVTVMADLQDGVEMVGRVMSSIETLAEMSGEVPWLGPIIKMAGEMVKFVHEHVVQHVLDFIASINGDLTNFDARICAISQKNDGFMSELAHATDMYDYGIKGVLFVDTCDAFANKVDDVCNILATVHRGANDLLGGINSTVQSLWTMTHNPRVLIQAMVSFLGNEVYTALHAVFEFAWNHGLGALKDMMVRVFEVDVPIPGLKDHTACTDIDLPCGVIWCSSWCCSWPCGTDWCTHHACVTVTLPTINWNTYRLTVAQVINGGMSLLKIVEDFISDVIEGVARLLGLPENSTSFPNNYMELIFSGLVGEMGHYIETGPVLPAISAEVTKFVNDQMGNDTCTLSNPSCTDQFAICSATMDCTVPVWSKSIEKNGTGYSAGLTADLTVVPSITMSMSQSDGFSGDFTIPVKFLSAFDLKLFGGGTNKSFVLPLNPVNHTFPVMAGPIPMAAIVSLQPRLGGSFWAEASGGSLMAGMECDLTISATVNRSGLTNKPATFNCTTNYSNNLSLSVAMSSKLWVEVDMAFMVNGVGINTTTKAELTVEAGTEVHGCAANIDVTAKAKSAGSVHAKPVCPEITALGNRLASNGFEKCALKAGVAILQPACTAVDSLFSIAAHNLSTWEHVASPWHKVLFNKTS